LFLFDGNESEINLKTKDQEFSSYQWIDIMETPNLVVNFKKDVYLKIAEYFDKKIKEFLFN